MGSRLNIYAIGMDMAWDNKSSNIAILEDYMSSMPANTDLVVLPELFSTGMITEDACLINSNSERNTGETITKLKKLANKYNTAIAGTFIARTEPKIFNRAFFIEPNENDTFYDKRHLFGLENKFYTPGNQLPPIIRYRGCNIMPIICYDLRFPCWCFNSDLKYDILIVMASWPKVREYAWNQLLIARAIENQAYVCGVNRSGYDINQLEFPLKSSVIIDYKGYPIGNYITGNSVWASIDLEDLKAARQKFPVWKDANDYKLLYDNIK